MNMLNDAKIDASRAAPDKIVLNTALQLADLFSKKRICSLSIKDVYDGSDILSSIVFATDKPPRTTPNFLKSVLQSYIDYIQRKYSIQQDAPLFPGYVGNSGEKKLQRHIREYSNYRDFNDVKKGLRAQSYQRPAGSGGDSRSRVKKIAQDTGKSERTIARSLDSTPMSSNPPTSKSKKFEDNDPRQFLKLLDSLVVWPEIEMLHEPE